MTPDDKAMILMAVRAHAGSLRDEAGSPQGHSMDGRRQMNEEADRLSKLATELEKSWQPPLEEHAYSAFLVMKGGLCVGCELRPIDEMPLDRIRICSFINRRYPIGLELVGGGYLTLKT